MVWTLLGLLVDVVFLCIFTSFYLGILNYYCCWKISIEVPMSILLLDLLLSVRTLDVYFLSIIPTSWTAIFMSLLQAVIVIKLQPSATSVLIFSLPSMSAILWFCILRPLLLNLNTLYFLMYSLLIVQRFTVDIRISFLDGTCFYNFFCSLF